MSPRFSILTPVYDPPADVLEDAIESVISQTWTDWELVLVDDASPSSHVSAVLDRFAVDPRVRVIRRSTNGGIIAASNDALGAASGDFLVLLDLDDLLDVDALAQVQETLASDDTIDYVYSDEDQLSLDGSRVNPFFKPDWSPERLRSQNYCCHLSVFRRSLVEEVGGFRAGYEGSQDYDLILRVTERARRIHHIPKVLYHWRQLPTSTAGDPTSKMYAYDAGRRAVQDHCDRIGIPAVVESQELLGTYRVRRLLSEQPLVSIIIPTQGSSGRVWGIERCYVVEAVRSIIERSTWTNVEFVVVADTDTPPDALTVLERIAGDRLRIVWYDAPFNFSEKINLGRVHARGEFLLLLNDDVEVISPDFIDTMVALAMDADVGSVGAKLLFADGTIQHAGHVYQPNPDHIFMFWHSSEVGPRGLLVMDREVVGSTAACLMMRPEVFDAVGGLSPDFRANFNDVDLALKLRRAGYRNVVSCHAQLYHFESVTRDPTVTQDELDLLFGRWGDELAADPYFNPNLEPFRRDWVERGGR